MLIKKMKFSGEEKTAIIADHKDGMCPKDLSLKYSRSPSSIINMLKSTGVFVHSRNRWTADEIELIKEKYPVCTNEELESIFPGRSMSDLHTKAHRLGISRDAFHWKSEDLEYLKENYMLLSADELYRYFDGRYTIKAIRTKGKRYNLAKHTNFWEAWEDQILRENYPYKPINQFIDLLPGRTPNAITIRANHLGLQSVFTNETYFSDQERQYIQENWNAMSDKDMAQCLERDPRSIKSQRETLGLLRINKEYRGYDCLDKIFRGQLFDWKKRSMELCGYQCVLTGSKDFHIHHIVGFNTILKEAYRKFDKMGVLKSKSIEDYSKEELDRLIEIFLEIHDSYPLGVCVRKDLHDMFHKEYGAGGNTKEQWDGFCKKVQEGVYEQQ